jgi:hypothetical protein
MKRRLALALTALIVTSAGASGDYGPNYTMFRAWTAPDIPLDRFQAGELGVIQPGMRRVYLYTAWRALSLGPRVAKAPGTQGGLARADGSAFGDGWSQPAAGDPVLEARLAVALHLPANDPQVRAIVACAPAATAYAAGVFHTASSRVDATAARIDAWLLAQQKVGTACQVADDARYRYGPAKPPVLAGPAPLAATEPLYWRQLNDYQRAAWAFQAGRYADSTPLFERIGATPDHPMHALGAYLALRSEVRSAVAADVKDVDPARREQQARTLERRGAVILADAALAPVHESTRALLRSMLVRLTPETRLAELNRALDDAAADPFALDRLGDWSVLVGAARPEVVEDLRPAHDFIDWIETVRGCTGIASNPACEPAGAHALARWRATGARPWLVAALMLPQPGVPELMEAGLALPPDDPAYVTVRYHLARLYRLDGKPRDALAMADGVLQRDLSPGTRNLLRQERFAVATSVPEAARYLLRTNVDYAKGVARFAQADLSVPDPTRDIVLDSAREIKLDDDGLVWTNLGLPVAGLVALARQPDLPPALRARIAGAAWIRAALLDNVKEGRAAGALLAQLAPITAPAVERYARANSPVERRHIVLVESVRVGLGAQLSMDAPPVTVAPADDATTSAWCAFNTWREAFVPGVEQETAPAFPWRRPPMPDTGDTGQRLAELARLGALKTATGVIGDDVLAWAASHPRDPELPWLLHVVVMSTRGGCLDKDAATLSRKAWDLLHKRYPGSEWAQKTPYFYAAK